VTGTAFAYFKVNGVDHGSVRTPGSGTRQVTFEVPDFVPEPGLNRIEITGTDWSRTPLWRVFATVRMTETVWTEEFDGGLGPFDVLTWSGTDEAGWNVADGALRIGDGVEYVNDLQTIAYMMVDVPATGLATIQADASIEIDEAGDLLIVYVYGNGEFLSKEYNGNLGQTDISVDLSPWAGQQVELGFHFASNGTINDRGVTIESVSLRH